MEAGQQALLVHLRSLLPGLPDTRRAQPCQLRPLTPILQRLAQILDSSEVVGERKKERPEAAAIVKEYRRVRCKHTTEPGCRPILIASGVCNIFLLIWLILWGLHRTARGLKVS